MTFFYVYIMNFSHFLQYFLLFSQRRNFSSRIFSLNSYTQKGYFLSIFLFLSLLLFLSLFSLFLYSLSIYLDSLYLFRLFLGFSFFFQVSCLCFNTFWICRSCIRDVFVGESFLLSIFTDRFTPAARRRDVSSFFLLYIFAQVRLFPLVSDFIFSLR